MLVKVNMNVLNGTKIYPEALFDLSVFGAHLDYWGRGYADLSDDQIKFINENYTDGFGTSVVGEKLDAPPEEGTMRMPNGHYRDYYMV